METLDKVINVLFPLGVALYIICASHRLDELEKELDRVKEDLKSLLKEVREGIEIWRHWTS